MAVDTPARIAIIGAGPTGLEAALYARFLGYDVDVFECGRVGENVQRWGHVRMFTPFALNRSPLGLAALAAQDPEYRPPQDHELLTGRQWTERYLVPLSRTDLMADHLRQQTRVLAVGRQSLWKTDMPGSADRDQSPLQLLVRDAQGNEHVHTADVVIDTSGVYGNPNWLGQGGIPARGERQAQAKIEYGLPDVLGHDRDRYAGRRVLLVGDGYSAATSAVALTTLAAEVPATQIIWITRRSQGEEGPIRVLPGDRLAQRDQLARAANRCAAASAQLEFWPETSVAAVEQAGEEAFRVELTGPHAGWQAFDCVLANVGYRPDVQLFQELQVPLCYATEGPIKLAAALMEQGSADCLDQTAGGVELLRLPEPDFYILGSKSYGRNSNFLVALGLQQIRDLFALIGDRADLDLYQGATSLPQ